MQCGILYLRGGGLLGSYLCRRGRMEGEEVTNRTNPILASIDARNSLLYHCWFLRICQDYHHLSPTSSRALLRLFSKQGKVSVTMKAAMIIWTPILSQ